MNQKKTPCFYHAAIPIAFMMIFMFVAIVRLDAGPQIPLVFSCLVAGLVSAWLGYSWDEILEGILEGIIGSLEAVLILLLIGMLVGAWIASGTVPTMICYGLKLVSASVFLPATMLICLLVAFAIGSWGTVGTIGLAFMGIGMALQIPAPMVAGAVVSGAYMGEVISPLSDATNLAAAVVGEDVFAIVRKALPAAVITGILTLGIYAVIGSSYRSAQPVVISQSVEPLLTGIREQFRITPIALLPMAVILICILLKMPAIPSMLLGGMIGMLQAVALQKLPVANVLEYAYSGYVSNSGNEMLDTLLTAGGMQGILETISIIIIAMAFGGIMKKTGQMEALVRPLVSGLQNIGAMKTLTVLSCIFMNIVLPDQYLGISMPGQMYGEACDRLKLGRDELGATLLGGGAVTSPLVPWNTCGIYCMSILGVSPVAYASHAYFGILMPVITILLGFFIVKSRSKEAK